MHSDHRMDRMLGYQIRSQIEARQFSVLFYAMTVVHEYSLFKCRWTKLEANTFPSGHGDKEYACRPDLPGRVVKCDKRGGRGSLLHSLSKEPDCNSLCYYTRSLNNLTKNNNWKLMLIIVSRIYRPQLYGWVNCLGLKVQPLRLGQHFM